MDTTFLAPNLSLSSTKSGCTGCRESRFALPIVMAFQPIVRSDGQVFAHEALVRGQNGEGAGAVLARVTDENRYSFDQLCRTTAIETAASLGIGGSGALLSINFKPNAIYEPVRCLSTSLAAARRVGLPNQAIMFEITEDEAVSDPRHLRNIVSAYREMGFKVAIDDFGAGHANFGLLAEFQPDIIKLDMKLARDIDADPVRQAIVRSLVGLCREIGIVLIAEGIETQAELAMLRRLGVELFQGYLFARPAIGVLQTPAMPLG